VKKHKNKKMLIMVLRVLAVVFFSKPCFALSDGIGDPTMPASSAQGGLVRSSNPVNNRSDSVITGNVSRGMQFHGLVPYRAATELGAPLSSEDISLFLRRSASTNLSNSASPQPYYLSSSTVSPIIQGSRNLVLSSPSIGNADGIGNYEVTELPKIQSSSKIAADTPLYDYSRTRPLSYDSTDLERVITYDLLQQRNKKELSNALQKASEELSKIAPEEAKPQSSLLTSEPAKPIEQPFEPIQPAQPAQPGQQPTAEAEQTASAKNVYEQMLEEIAAISQAQKAAKSDKQKAEEPNQTMVQEPQEKQKGPADLRSQYSQIDKETAEAVVGIHKSFATESKDKFNYYMRSAEEFLKEGKYYRAADAYTLAGIYKPDDPLAFAGRAHALFASGEYMSSAYFLSRAVNIFPQYVKFKIDLNAMIPDKDKLESRIADIKLWIERTSSAELSFLLAYIYYQLDKTELAEEAIKFAAEKIPDSVSIAILKQAIEKK
jgi:hypothetical protein